jgi:probable HAF family extracellular repeat protein
MWKIESIYVDRVRQNFKNGETVMEPRALAKISAITLFAAMFAAFPLAAQTQAQSGSPHKYYVFNLGSGPLGGVPEPVGINDLGWISGGDNSATNTTVNAVLWAGVPLDLGTLGGPNSNVSWPNHSITGEIVGIAETAEANPLGEAWSCSAFFFGPDGYQCLGFAWQDGVMSPLPPFPGGIDSYAAGVNNEGQVVGWAENGVHDPTCNHNPPFSQFLQFEAAIWGPRLNQMTQLSPLPGDPDSAATAINDRGQVVGISGLCSNAVGGASAKHALLWEHGVPLDLGNIGGHAWNTPTSLNNEGVVVGFGNISGDENAAENPAAFIWTKAKGIKEIYPLGTDPNDVLFDINGKNQAVGNSFNFNVVPGVSRAVLWQNETLCDLNTLVIQPTSLYLTLAQGINDAGEIVGTATDTSTGGTVGFLAIPVFDGSGNPAAAKSNTNPQEVVLSEPMRKHLPFFVRQVFESAEGK